MIYDVVIPIVLALVSSFAVTKWVQVSARTLGLIDQPNERSMHVQPTPRGGGIGIVLTFIVAMVWLALADNGLQKSLLLTLACALPVAVVGLVDDVRNLPSLPRFAVHLLASGGIVGIAMNDGGFWPPSGLHWVVGGVITVVAVTWLINLYNFMDGIDGIAASEALFVALGAIVCLTFGPSSDSSIWLPLLVLAASCVGFLFWNAAPARIFMGDVGSGFLGAVFGGFAVFSSITGTISLWVWVTLLGCFIVDSTFTLLRRMARGEKWHQPHRNHAFQKAARRWSSHTKVVSAVGAINVLWLLPCAVCAQIFESWAPAFCALALAPLVALAGVLGAGLPDKVDEQPVVS